MPCPAKDLDETMPSARVCEEEEPKETLVVFCWHGGNPLLACSDRHAVPLLKERPGCECYRARVAHFGLFRCPTAGFGTAGRFLKHLELNRQ